MNSALETLEQQEKKLAEKMEAVKARKQAIINREKAKKKDQDRKDDLRRKILIGSCLLNLSSQSEFEHTELMKKLDKYLAEERDRSLFNLGEKNV